MSRDFRVNKLYGILQISHSKLRFRNTGTADVQMIIALQSCNAVDDANNDHGFVVVVVESPPGVVTESVVVDVPTRGVVTTSQTTI